MKATHKFIGILLPVMVLALCLAGVASPPVAQAQAVQVLSADPPSAAQGTVNLNVLIKGKGFKKGAKAKFQVTGTSDPGGVTVNSTTFVDATTLTANINVADTAVLSKYDIQVMLSDGRGGKGTELFSVTPKGSGNQACTLPAPLLTAPTACTDSRSGCLDASFGTGGIGFSYTHTTGEAIAIQPWDGKIIAAGIFIQDGVGTGYGVVRYNPDGTLDAGFGSGGIAAFLIPGDSSINWWYARAVALQPDGKIVVAGDGFWIMRLNPDGSPDAGFGTGGKVQMFVSLASNAWNIALQGDGKIVAVGTGNSSRKQTLAWHIGRLTTTGSPDPSFGNGGQVAVEQYGGIARALVIQRVQVGSGQEERIVVGANGKTTGSVANIALMRLNPNGTADTSFGPNGVVLSNVCSSNHWTEALAVDAANNIIVAGVTDVGGGRSSLVARYTANGILDTSFGTSKTGFVLINIFGDGSVWDVIKGGVIQADGKIVVGGFASAPTQFAHRFFLVRFNPDGTLDANFGVGGVAAVDTGGSGKKIAIQPWDGKIVQAGYETLSGTWDSSLAVIRYLP